MKLTRAIFVFLILVQVTVAEKVKEQDGGMTILPERPAKLPVPEQLELTKKIHALIVAKAAEEKVAAEKKEFSVKVPKAKDAPLKFVAIPGGEFLMGSPESEASRKADEGPRKKVRISPFWMTETEITWEFFLPYMVNNPDFKKPRNKDGSLDQDNDRYTSEPPNFKLPLVDAVSQPTIQYWFPSEMKRDGNYPACNMTNHAASKFCQWLSAQTGYFYRLPTEAEWEYACRAGTTTAYSFGNDPSKLEDFAWTIDNNEFYSLPAQYPVKKKNPNAWGLFDMHGNLAEWTIDAYSADSFKKLPDGVENPWVYPAKRYPRVIRGGSWDSDSEEVRSAARLASSKDLKIQEAQVPKSLWHHTDAHHIGFRVVRPVKIPSVEEMLLFWNNDFLSAERTKEEL